ncbi:MAG: GNAT family N-acetyltransferase [Arenibacterium sp.]
MTKSDRPLGEVVENWKTPPWPFDVALEGAHVRLEPLNADKHARGLFNAYGNAGWLWDYLADGPYDRFEDYDAWVRSAASQGDTLFLAILDRDSGTPLGIASYLRINPGAGSIEVGNINFSPLLQQKPGATEAMALMMTWAFDAGYRRYEWKCNALNAPSRRAAERLGFSFEGVFRQALIVKGRNRDTAWFAITDKEWPGVQSAHRTWLSPKNFDSNGQQLQKLGDLTAPFRVSSDPSLGK